MFNFFQNRTEVAKKHIELPEESPLASIIQNKPFVVNESPCRYVVIDDFFEKKFYQKLVKEFQDVYDRGLSETPHQDLLSRYSGYDAYVYTPSPYQTSPLNVMRTPEWKKYIEQFFDIDLSQDEIMAFHHHKVGSQDGWVHNDYSLCSFVNDPLSNGLNSWYHQCKYEDHSEGKQPNTKKVMRAQTLIYYFNNNCNGKHGGGTTLFDVNKEPVVTVEPKNNRLFSFEVSPVSYHAFQTNKMYTRDTIIQFWHQDPDLTFKRFNNKDYVPW